MAGSLQMLVAREGMTVAVAQSLRDARRQVLLQRPDLILLDLQLPDGSGLELFDDEALVENTTIVLVTGYASLKTSIQALRLGAADYLVKPVNIRQLEGVLSRLVRPSALRTEIEALSADVEHHGHFGLLWGRSPPMQRVYEQISRVAGTGVAVFVNGESGTGKELVAQTIHDLSRRRDKPFFAVNCGAISPNLIESELFGHEKGSFTGADRQHIGFFEHANGGTLFLDEITEMPLELQVKLLRVLETGSFVRVGSTSTVDVDVRIIAASNRDIGKAISTGKLREDLLYRLNVFPIELPPLRDRLSDVPLLADNFLQRISEQEGKPKRFTAAALDRLCRYSWPGNVRELRNAVQRAYVMSADEVIDERWLPVDAQPAQTARATIPASGADARRRSRRIVSPEAGVAGAPAVVSLPIGSSMAEIEKAMILATLRHYGHHREQTAAVLGISMKTLYNRLKDYQTEDPEGVADAMAYRDEDEGPPRS